MGCCGDNIRRLAHGATGLAKSLAGVDLARPATIEARRMLCRACPHAKPCKRNPQRKCTCELCGCLLTHKTRLASEACPVGKWAAVAAE